MLIDPSAASFKAELAQRGSVWQENADNDVIDGIRKMGSALKQGKVRVHAKNCPDMCREMPEYAWDDRASKLGKEAPKKVADHCPDAARYVGNYVLKSWRLAE